MKTKKDSSDMHGLAGRKFHYTHPQTARERDKALEIELHASEIREKLKNFMMKKGGGDLKLVFHRDSRNKLCCDGVHLVRDFYTATFDVHREVLGSVVPHAKVQGAYEEHQQDSFYLSEMAKQASHLGAGESLKVDKSLFE